MTVNQSTATSKKETLKKVLRISETVISWILVALTVAMMIFTCFSLTFTDSAERNLFGYRWFRVDGDSMKDTFQYGDIIISRDVDPDDLKEGDIITFISQDSANYGQFVTHKIRKRTLDSMGREGFTTYGTTTGDDDRTVVSANYVVGLYQGRLPGLGHLVTFLKSGVGFILCILLPFLAVVAMHGVKVLFTFLSWRREQMEEIERMHERIRQTVAVLPAMKQRYGEEGQAALTEVEQLLRMDEWDLSAFDEKAPEIRKQKRSPEGVMSPHTSKKKIRRRQVAEDRQRKADWLSKQK